MPTGQPLLDLNRLMLAIRRRRRLWLALSLVGLIMGAALAVLMPSPPTAIVRILVVHEDDQPSDPGTLIRTDVALLSTAKMAGAALEKAGSTEKPEDFLKEYTVLGATNNVLEVTVKAKTSADAVRKAKALADVFIADHVARIKAGADSEAKALTDQRNRVQAELKQVNNQIATAEAKQSQGNNGNGNVNGNGNGAQGTSQGSAANLDSLYARRAELTSRVSDLSTQAEQASIGAPRVAAGTQIVDQPRALKVSQRKTLLTNSGIGLVLGLIIGWMLAGITGVVKDKPVLRKDIAANLGASVIAQLAGPRRGLARLWRRKRLVRERHRVAGTLVRLVRSGTGSGSVSVLELGSRRIAAALALDVATRLAGDRSVVLVEDSAGRVIADDMPGRDPEEAAGQPDRPIRIVAAAETASSRPGETRIGIGSLMPGTAWTDLRHLGKETVLIVRTGFANTAWLHTVARQLADQQIPIIGVVVVDPDPRDKSDGTLWDGLHMALRGRTQLAVPEPIRLPAAGRKPARTPEPVARPVPQRAEPGKPTTRPEPITDSSWPRPPQPAVAKTEPEPAERTMAAVAAKPAGEPAETTSPEPGVPGTRETGREPAPGHKPAAAESGREPAQGTQRPSGSTSVPAHYPAPVRASGTNGSADLPTRRFAPVQPAKNGTSDEVHDPPTKRFPPVRPEDVEELVHRRTNS